MAGTPDPVEPGSAPAAEPAAAPVTTVEPAVTFVPHTETPGLLSIDAPPATEPAVEVPAAPAVEPQPAEPAPAEVKAEGVEAKPAVPAVEVKPAEPAAEVKPVEPPAPIEPFKYDTPPTLPEGITVDPARIAEFDSIVGAHRLPPEARQGLVDFHVEEIRRYHERKLAEQHRLFGETRKAWRDQVASDEELGGSAFQTNRAAAIRVIDNFVPQPRRQAFEAMMRGTGVADHPEFMRFLVNLDKKFGSPPVPTPPNNPAPDRGGRPGGRRARDVLYGNTTYER